MQKNYNVGVIELISFSERIDLLIKHVVFEGSVIMEFLPLKERSAFLIFQAKFRIITINICFLCFNYIQITKLKS